MGLSRTPRQPPPAQTYLTFLIECKETDTPQSIAGMPTKRCGSCSETSTRQGLKPSVPKGGSVRRDRIEFPEGAVISRGNLISYENAAKEYGKKAAKHFLKAVYEDPGYVKVFGKTKRGGKAINWRPTGEWKCPSLHYANCIYELMGKNKWIKNGNHGLQFHHSKKDQCVFMTDKGTRCVRSTSSSHEGSYCTQHHKIFKIP